MKIRVLFIYFFLFPFIATAQNEINLDTIPKENTGITLFSSPYEAQKQVPVSFSQINAATIRLLDYGTEPTYLLQRIPGVSFTTDNGTPFGYSGFRLRGIDQNRINITINGLPLNEAEDAGTYFSNFSGLLSYASTIQLQRGIGLSKLGAPAFAGSLDFDTRKNLANHSDIGLQAGSFGTVQLNAETQQGNEKNLIAAGINAVRTDGFKYHSGNQSGSGLFQWEHRSLKTKLLYLLLAGSNKNNLSWLGVTDSIAKSDFKQNGNSEPEKGNFSQLLQQFHITTSLAKNQTLHAGVFYNYTKGSYIFDLYNFLYLPPSNSLIEYRTRSNYLGLLIDYKYTKNNLTVSAGLYSSYYKKNHAGVTLPTAIAQYSNYGIKNELSPFVKFIFRKNRFYFFSDIQYRITQFSYHGDVAIKAFNWHFINPLAGLGYRLNNYFYLYASAGDIKREPGRNDIFLGNDNLLKDSTGKAIYNDLNAEQNFSVEAGIRYKDEKWEGVLNIYRMEILDAIDLNGQIGPTGLPLHSNVAKAIRAGAELELRYLLSNKISLLQSLAYAPHSIMEDKKSSIPVLTPRWISFSELQSSFYKFTFIVQGRYQSKSYIDFGNNYTLPSSFIVNLVTKYQYKRTTFSFRLLNITDKKMYSSGQLNVYSKPIYQVQAPFNLLTSIQINL